MDFVVIGSGTGDQSISSPISGQSQSSVITTVTVSSPSPSSSPSLSSPPSSLSSSSSGSITSLASTTLMNAGSASASPYTASNTDSRGYDFQVTGVVMGVIIALGLLSTGLVLYLRRRRLQQTLSSSHSFPGPFLSPPRKRPSLHLSIPRAFSLSRRSQSRNSFLPTHKSSCSQTSSNPSMIAPPQTRARIPSGGSKRLAYLRYQGASGLGRDDDDSRNSRHINRPPGQRARLPISIFGTTDASFASSPSQRVPCFRRNDYRDEHWVRHELRL